MRFILVVVTFLSLATTNQAQTISDTLVFDDTNRFYSIYVPENVKDETNLPLVFNLHGRGSSGTQQQIYSAMNEVADTAGFIVCYPDGIDEVWNSGFDPNGVNDTGFINALIDEIDKDYDINLDKVYTCGMSNGGYQSLYMACELTNRFAAVASVTGSMVKPVLDNCQPSKAIPVMQIHGTDDDTVLYGGSDIATPIEEVVQFWAAHNACNSVGDTLQIENIDTTDNSTAERIAYTNGTDNSEVIFYKITNGGHTWPGSPNAINDVFGLGVVNQDFNASEAIWNFFNQFSLSDSLPLNNENLFLSELEIFPNPFHQFIYINGNIAYSEVQLVDLNGRLKYQAYLPQGELSTKIQFNELSSGIYLIKLIAKDYTHWHKIIKNK